MVTQEPPPCQACAEGKACKDKPQPGRTKGFRTYFVLPGETLSYRGHTYRDGEAVEMSYPGAAAHHLMIETEEERASRAGKGTR